MIFDSDWLVAIDAGREGRGGLTSTLGSLYNESMTLFCLFLLFWSAMDLSDTFLRENAAIIMIQTNLQFYQENIVDY